MTNYFDDDDEFWASRAHDDRGFDDPDATRQVDRVRARGPERTRTHHVVRRDASALHDADDMLWLEPEYRRTRAAGTGAFRSVDPRALSLGALTLAAVLAVPLFGALSDGGGSKGDALRAVAQSQRETTTTAVVPLPPTTVVPVTAAVTAAVQSGSDSSQAARAGSDSSSSSSSSSSSASGGGSSQSSSGTSGSGSSDQAATGQAAAAPARTECTNTYSAVAGDYWLRIADQVDVSLDKILSLNNAAADTPLYPGSEVCLPDGASAPAPPATEPATTAPATTEPDTTPATTEPPTTEPPTTQPPTTQPPETDPPTTQPPQTDPPTTQPPATTEAPNGGIPLPTNPAPSGGDVEQIIREVWPDELEAQALRIAWRESNYRPDVTSSTGCCVGVFQLNWNAHSGWLIAMGVTARSQLFDARTNVEAAYALYQRSGGWAPWT